MLNHKYYSVLIFVSFLCSLHPQSLKDINQMLIKSILGVGTHTCSSCINKMIPSKIAASLISPLAQSAARAHGRRGTGMSHLTVKGNNAEREAVHFLHPISHFLMFKSHSSFQFSSYYMFPCHHFLIFIIRV